MSKTIKYVHIICTMLCFLIQSGCNPTEEQNNTSENNLPSASGASGEIMLFMDTSLMKKSVGKEIQAVFSSMQPGLLQGEKRFRVSYVNPLKINKFIKMHKNLIFVTLINGKSSGNRKLQEYFPKEAFIKIRNNPDYFMFTKENVYAKGQRILHLFSYDPQDLVRNLKKHKKALRQIFEAQEIKRFQAQMAKNQQEEIVKKLNESHQMSMLIPKGYQHVKSEDSLIWFRFPERKIDRNLLIVSKKYQSENQFSPDSMLAWRNQIAKKHLFADPQFPSSYMLTEMREPPVFTQTTLNGNYALQMRGLWRTNAKYLMGGPFISYLLVNADASRLYYIEGFVYAPGESKRELIRELNAILSSAKSL